ncbi:MAG: response regulator, partial [Elusimicrobia bacterium]|nr:response regulator [Elusimicrobiota bacterium]
ALPIYPDGEGLPDPLRGSGEEAAVLCRGQERIDLLLADLALPDTDGVELSERLCALRPGLKTVYMSGYPGGIAGNIDKICSETLLEKPFSPEALLNALRRALDSPRGSAPAAA